MGGDVELRRSLPDGYRGRPATDDGTSPTRAFGLLGSAAPAATIGLAAASAPFDRPAAADPALSAPVDG